MALHVVDISSWQAGIDVAKLKDADAVIVKATGGTGYVNPYWKKWADAALRAGKALGLYHYAQERGCKGTAAQEAAFFLKTVKGYEDRAVLVLDWEADALSLPASWARAWLDAVAAKSAGTPFFYGYASNVNSADYSSIAKKYPLWMASYLDRYRGAGFVDDPANTWKTGAWAKMAMYQYTSTGRIAGYSGDLDLSAFYGTRADWDAYAGTKRSTAAKAAAKATAAVSASKASARQDSGYTLGQVAAAIHKDMCDDDANGYSWNPRWGEDGKGGKTLEIGGGKYSYDRGSYDCSSSVIAAWRLALAGTGHEHALDAATYTGNMRGVFVGSGLFEWKPMSFLAEPGDLYLNEASHVAMCQTQVPDVLSQFSINENGGVYGGKVGDQTGKEAYLRGYYDYPWDGILHYNGKADAKSSAGTSTAKAASKKSVAAIAQEVVDGKWGNGDERKRRLEAAGYDYDAVQAKVNALLAPKASLAVDGEWGPATTRALQAQLGVAQDGACGPVTYKALQKKLGVTADGIFGPQTKKALQRKLGVTVDGVVGPQTVKALQRALNAGKVASW